MRSVERRQDYRAGYRPGNQRRNHHGRVFKLNRKDLGIRFDTAAKLVREHYRKRLVAGYHARDNRRDDHSKERRNFFAQTNHQSLEAIEEARRLENARVTARNAEDSQDVRH